jgi:hypothetical protein
MKLSALFTTALLSLTLVGSAFAQDDGVGLALDRAEDSATPAPTAAKADQKALTATLDAMQAQLDKSRKLLAETTGQLGRTQKALVDQNEQVSQLEKRATSAEEKIEALDNVDSHQTIGFGIGDSIALGGGKNHLMVEANVRWIYAQYHSGAGWGAGLRSNLDIFNVIMLHPISLGMFSYTGSAPYTSPEFGANRVDLTVGTGASFRIFKGAKISAGIMWYFANPASAFSTAKGLIDAAKGENTTAPTTGIAQIDQSAGQLNQAQNTANDVQAKIAAGADAGKLVADSYTYAATHPRLQVTLDYWF